MSQRPDIEEDFHTQIYLFLSLSLLLWVEEAKVTTATCNHMWHTDFSPTNKLIWKISRNWRARKKQTTTWNCPSLFFFFSSSLFAHLFIFFGLRTKNMWSMPCRYKKNAQKVAFIKQVFFFILLQHSDSDFKRARESCERQKGEEF